MNALHSFKKKNNTRDFFLWFQDLAQIGLQEKKEDDFYFKSWLSNMGYVVFSLNNIIFYSIKFYK